MDVQGLINGNVYWLHLRGIYGQAKATYLGKETYDGKDRYAFFDGECGYSNIADASRTVMDKAQIIRFSAEEVFRYVGRTKIITTTTV